MSTVLKQRISSASSAETEALAAKLGKRLKGGETLELISDLGGGKTTFVRGLAHGAGSEDKVASPSFTLAREYHGKGLTIYHYDFYRLQEPGILRHELQEALADPRGVVVVEWADIVQGVLPAERLSVAIRTTGEGTRELSFTYPESLQYVMRELS